MDDLVIRPYHRPDDDAALKALPMPEGHVRLPRDDVWGRVAEVGGTVAGFSRVDHWDEADGTRLYLLSGCVAPAFRRQGIGRALLAQQEAQAAAHWHADPGSGPALLGGNADQTRPDTLALLVAAGYRVRFTLVDLARDLSGAAKEDGQLSADPARHLPGAAKDEPSAGPAREAASAELPGDLDLRPVRADDHPRIHETLRICFADSGHGQHTQTYEGYLRDVRDVDLWLVAWDGDEVAAVLINEREKDGSVDTPWVAVMPAWRRHGVAKALLQRSLRLLAGHGVTTATIRTVQENNNQTVALYERAGYRVTARHPRYAKPL